MDELSRDARAALRRYHAAASLDPAAHDRVWRNIAGAVEEAERPGWRGRYIVVPVLVGLAAAAVLLVCDVRARLEPSLRVDAAAYETAPAPVRASQMRAPVAPTSEANEVGKASEASEASVMPVRPSRRPPVVSTEDRGLAAEVAYMRQARAAIDRGEPEAALRALDGHAREFAAGQMLEDRRRLHIEALCALGRREQARALADEFLRDLPGSPHAARVRGLCREPDLP